MAISIAQAFAQFQELDLDRSDRCLMAEAWNDYTDSLCKDGELTDLQLHHCPAFDDAMPDEGTVYDALAGDREFILAAMKINAESVFVPFSRSRNSAEKSPSLNWRVTLFYRGRDVIETDYTQGSAHCPAYKKPVKFPGGNTDQYATKKAIDSECETGKRASRLNANGKKIEGPDVVDVLHSLLLDSNAALNARDFADFAAYMGMDDDSISAKKIYYDCLAIALKMRAAFGEKTITELSELFEGM